MDIYYTSFVAFVRIMIMGFLGHKTFACANPSSSELHYRSIKQATIKHPLYTSQRIARRSSATYPSDILPLSASQEPLNHIPTPPYNEAPHHPRPPSHRPPHHPPHPRARRYPHTLMVQVQEPRLLRHCRQIRLPQRAPRQDLERDAPLLETLTIHEPLAILHRSRLHVQALLPQAGRRRARALLQSQLLGQGHRQPGRQDHRPRPPQHAESRGLGLHGQVSEILAE